MKIGRVLCSCVLLAGLAAVAPGSAMAKGCVKGAVVGAVAGHMAGRHTKTGAVAGCVIGHHEANKASKTKNAKSNGGD